MSKSENPNGLDPSPLASNHQPTSDAPAGAGGRPRPVKAGPLRYCYSILTQSPGWYYTNFIRGFCYYLLLPLMFLLSVGLMWGVVAADYGPAYLFFHDAGEKVFVVGVSLGFFWAEVLFVGYLLWLRDGRHGRLVSVFESWLKESARDEAGGGKPRLSFTGFATLTFTCMAVTVIGYKLIVGFGERAFSVLGLPVSAATGTAESAANSYNMSWKDTLLFVGVGAVWIVLWGLGHLFQRWAAHRGMMWLARHLGSVAPPPGAKPADVARPARWRLLFKWPLVVAVPTVWLIVVVALIREKKEGMHYWGPVVLTAVGLLATSACALPRLKRSNALFWAAVVANVVLAYTGAAWCISSNPAGALAGVGATVVGAALGAVWVRTVLPDRWDQGYRFLGRTLIPLGKTEQSYLFTGVVFLAGALLVLMALAFCPNLSSPVPTIMLLLNCVVAVYGLLAYLLPRTVLIVGGGVVLLAFIANIQPYRLRFAESLPYYTNKDVLHLAEELGRERNGEDGGDGDLGRQRAFDGMLYNFQLNEKKIAKNENLVRTLYLSLALGGVAPGNIAETRQQLTSAEKDLERNRRDKKDFLRDLESAWHEIEEKNRVRAGRLLPGLKLQYPDLVRLEAIRPKGAPKLLTTDQLEVWPRGGRDRNGPLVVVAVSGGGIRSAVWTFLVLKELELAFSDPTVPGHLRIDFPSHVRLITGASGGMVGAAYYVVTLPSPEYRPPQLEGQQAWDRRKEVLETQLQRLASDFLTPLVRRMVFSDAPGLLSPWPLKYDRGHALEQAWSYYLKGPVDDDSGHHLAECGPEAGALDVNFASLREGEKRGWRPSLVFTPMMIEDGRRLIISNLDMRYAISNDGWVLTQESTRNESLVQPRDNHSVEAMELFRMFKNAPDTFSPANAARMSASFPYFSPAVSLPTVPRRRIVDAGYYDNYGVSLAASWLFSQDNRTWIDGKFNRVLLIQIRDGLTEKERQLRSIKMDDSDFLSRTLEELTSPPEGLLNARVASSSFRNDGQLELLNHLKEARNVTQNDWRDAEFLVANFELENPASLSWYLSAAEQRRINSGKDRVKKTVDSLFEWVGNSSSR